MGRIACLLALCLASTALVTHAAPSPLARRTYGPGASAEQWLKIPFAKQQTFYQNLVLPQHSPLYEDWKKWYTELRDPETRRLTEEYYSKQLELVGKVPALLEVVPRA